MAGLPNRRPRAASGKIDLTAPPPRADGKIDFTGLWEPARGPGRGGAQAKGTPPPATPPLANNDPKLVRVNHRLMTDTELMEFVCEERDPYTTSGKNDRSRGRIVPVSPRVLHESQRRARRSSGVAVGAVGELAGSAARPEHADSDRGWACAGSVGEFLGGDAFQLGRKQGAVPGTAGIHDP